MKRGAGTALRVVSDREVAFAVACEAAGPPRSVGDMLKRISEYDYSALSSTDRVWMLARNPYSRVLSLYLHKIVGLCKFGSLGCKDHGERTKFAGIMGYNASAPPTFSAWVDLLAHVMVRLQVRARRNLPAVATTRMILRDFRGCDAVGTGSVPMLHDAACLPVAGSRNRPLHGGQALLLANFRLCLAAGQGSHGSEIRGAVEVVPGLHIHQSMQHHMLRGEGLRHRTCQV